MLDISLNGGSITITTETGIRDFDAPFNTTFRIKDNGDIKIQIKNFTYESLYADFTISGVQPESAAAARSSLRALFLSAGGVTGETNLEAVATDIIITDSSNGLVLKSANGNQHRISINNDGSITTTQL